MIDSANCKIGDNKGREGDIESNQSKKNLKKKIDKGRSVWYTK